LLRAIGREDLTDNPRVAGRPARVANMDFVDALVGEWTQRSSRDAVVALFASERIPHAPVRDLNEVMNDRHMHERKSLQWMEHPQYGRIVMPHSPIRHESAPLIPLRSSEPLGASNHAVYEEWLGLSEGQVEALRRDGVI
jgi:CoA:oxalate CoA-transferase